MKFAHDFDSSLKSEEYPQEWVDSAISYRQLKKCIKRVQQELQGLGLDSQTLELLWQQIDGPYISSNEAGGRVSSKPYQYSFSDDLAKFRPKLTIAVDTHDGALVDAWLSPQTREFLRGLAISQQAQRRQSVTYDATDPYGTRDPTHSALSSQQDTTTVTERDPLDTDTFNEVETVEIPLTSDSEFFQVLKRELVDLGRLQESEQRRLNRDIVRLGHDLTTVSQSSSSNSKKSRAEIQAWREIFRLYVESEIFFSSLEQDAGPRDSQHAQKQLQSFTKELAVQQQKALKLDRSSQDALKRFLQINKSLLQFLKFQEINQIALSKILKKFDKRTALRAQATLPMVISKAPFIAESLAKAACFTISNELLALIPQLDDYLCPVCFSVSFKPVRLRCNHIFCIRCLILMQRKEQDHCPLCRAAVVLEASSRHLDVKLAEFLKEKFPAEVKAKQKENERAAGVDRFGPAYEDNSCLVM